MLGYILFLVGVLLVGVAAGFAAGIWLFFLPACELIVAIDDEFPQVFPPDVRGQINDLRKLVRTFKGDSR